jgi:hypothetical protein
MYKIIFNTVLIAVIATAIFFFGFTDSYKTSLKAKVKYISGDYKEARELARDAFEQDPYNRMAISVLAQSKISAEFVDYINDGEKYLDKIKELTKKDNFSKADKTKIKMMCEVMIGRYDKLSSTVMTDSDLKNASKRIYQQFKSIYEELFSTKE